jgi:chromosome segregation ATPase
LAGLLPSGDGGSDALRKILKDFYDQLKILDDKIKKPPICGGRNICDTLKDINGELKKAKRERKELKDKLKKLDERLKEAEKQNDEISKYLPPEECS